MFVSGWFPDSNGDSAAVEDVDAGDVWEMCDCCHGGIMSVRASETCSVVDDVCFGGEDNIECRFWSWVRIPSWAEDF